MTLWSPEKSLGEAIVEETDITVVERPSLKGSWRKVEHPLAVRESLKKARESLLLKESPVAEVPAFWRSQYHETIMKDSSSH